MAPRIVIIGGGSNQWVPTLVTDLANTPTLHGTEIVLEDIDAAKLPRMADYVRHVADVRDIPLTVSTTTDQRQALQGADYVVVTISTGGFRSMRHDLDIPARYGIQQSVGDTVGPGGINRCLRNVPVMLGVARDMAELCPDAWLLNLTNPMTTLCRAVTRETPVKTIGLCHEVTIATFYLSMLLSANFMEIRPTVVGVNHLPVITALDVGGEDGLALLRDLLSDPAKQAENLPFNLPDDLGHEPPQGRDWTKADLIAVNQLKLELFRLTGALPGAGDRHLAEFFPGFLTEASGWGKRWGVSLTPIADRQADEANYADRLERLTEDPEVSTWPSGEIVAPLIDSFITGTPRLFPLNIPNTGQVPDLPLGRVVESMCWADGDGARGGEPAAAPPLLASYLRRVSESQELAVNAALSGRRDDVLAAMLADPLASRIDYDQLAAMTDELIAATKEWLPQFA
ncbi:MAG: glycoside hydrolase family 4 [Acidimicrobiales bacterium]|jgi:alpha-galactosidase|nr:glycoside hydrolase family 4 [Acidimicrobiales bacterium]